MIILLLISLGPEINQLNTLVTQILIPQHVQENLFFSRKEVKRK
jgi:hypothetical protein